MKKLLIVSIGILFALNYVACKNDEDESTGGGGGSTVTAISADVETTDAAKGAEFSKEVSIDLKDNPLTEEAFAALQAGTVDVNSYFRQSSVEKASRTVATDDGLEGFRATLKSSSTRFKIEVEIHATTPANDCTVLITAVIPAEATENKKAYVSLVSQVKVGVGAGEASDTALSSSIAVPSETEVTGLVLRYEHKSGDIDHYQFLKEDNDIVVYRYETYNNYTHKSSTVYIYNPSTGELKKNSSKGSAKSSAGMSKYLAKAGGNYYIIENKVARVSGKGLDSTFTESIKISESMSAENDKTGQSYSVGTATLNYEMTLTTTSSLTFTAAVKDSVSVSYSAEYKQFLEEQIKALEAQRTESEAYGGQEYYDSMIASIREQLNGATESFSCDVTGVYVNNDGILTMKGKVYRTETKYNGDVETEVEEFDSTEALYDGTTVYFAVRCAVADSVPAVSY